MQIKLFEIYFVFLKVFFKTCVIYFRELFVFKYFTLLATNNYKSIKLIHNDLYKKFTLAKSKQNYKLSRRYTSENKRV